MSYERGWSAIHLEMPDRIPQVEFISHDAFTLKHTGVDTRDPAQRPQAWPALAKAFDFDFVWNQEEVWSGRGRFTKLGHAEWSATDGKDSETGCPFQSVEEVLAFDPIAEYGIAPHAEMVAQFQKNQDRCKINYPDTVFPGGRYHTLFSACIRSFGWDLFMMAAQTDPEQFNRVLQGFAKITRAEINAWLDTDVKILLIHDDIVWASGPVFSPEWYRHYIFPKYVDLWKPIHEAGKKVIFCADGMWTPFIDDIAQAGADGFIFEPMTDLNTVVARYGQSHIIMGNADCRVLMYGNKDDIRNEVERCVTLGKACPGYFMCMGNHIPNAIPLEHVEYYFEVFEELRQR